MLFTRKEKREAVRQLSKEALDLLINHDRQLLECGFWLDVIMTALKDAGVLDDEKVEVAKKKVVERLQEAQKGLQSKPA